jgi:hypothetical protein
MDVPHYLYYTNVPDLAFRDLKMLASLNNKAMENV